jgi:hypothetical protein
VANALMSEAKRRRRGGRLCRAGWTAFAVSLALPAISAPLGGSLSGWECLRGVFEGTWDLLAGVDSISLYWSGFAAANVIMLASPLYVRLFRRDVRWLRRGALALAAATLYVGTFPLSGDVRLQDLGVGYYTWLVSFGLVTAGMLHLSLRRPARPVEVGPSVGARTREETAALRELEDYLHGEVRLKAPTEEAATSEITESTSAFRAKSVHQAC